MLRNFLSAVVLYLITIGQSFAISNGSGGENATQQDRSTAYRTAVFHVKPGVKITATSPSGNISVRGVPGDTVRIELYVRRGLNILSPDRSLDEFRIQMFQKENEIIAMVDSRRSGAWSSSIPQFNFIIYVPESASGHLNAMGGNIEVSNIKGDHRILATGGNVILNNVGGVSRINSQGGNISVNVHSGELRLRSMGGSIAIDDIVGSVLAKSMGGNINANFKRIDIGIDLEAIGGSIIADLPGGIGMDMNVTAMQVNLNRIQNFAGEIKRNSVVGKLNGGGLPVIIKSSGGTIDLQVHQDR